MVCWWNATLLLLLVVTLQSHHLISVLALRPTSKSSSSHRSSRYSDASLPHQSSSSSLSKNSNKVNRQRSRQQQGDHRILTRERGQQRDYSHSISLSNSSLSSSTANLTATSATAPQIPPCLSDPSDLVYLNGVLSATDTFFACLANVADAGMLPTFFNGSYTGVTVLNTTIVMNNLETIDEIQGTVRLQFSVRFFWQDNRFAMPIFWQQMNPNTYARGIDLTKPILDNDNVILWLPIIRFPDASEVNILAEYLNFNASNTFFLAYSLDITLVQPGFNFRLYPDDVQDIVIRYATYNYNQQYTQIGFYPNDALYFNQYADGSDTFKSNQIWTFENAEYYVAISNSNTYAVYVFTVKRQGSGIIVRLVLPIALLLLLSTLTFWVLYENRVDTTITLLLSVSALYIVILGNIPLVGYLTNVDRFVFWMFLLLVAVVSMHQVYVTLKQKVERWPLRAIVLRLIELIGRVFILPFITVYFLVMITFDDAFFTSEALIGLSVTFTVIIGIQEWFGLRICCLRALDKLIEKVNTPETTVNDLSYAEFFVLNWIEFHKISFSKLLVAKELQEKGALNRFVDATLQIRHLAKANALLRSEEGSSSSSSSASTMMDVFHQRTHDMQSKDTLSNHNQDNNGVELQPFQRVRSMVLKKSYPNPLDAQTVNPLRSSVMAAHDSDDES